MNSKMREILDERVETKKLKVEYLLETLSEQTQPLTALEVMHLYQHSGLGSIDVNQIRKYLYELADANKVYVRLETDEERLVRGGGETAFGPLAAFFSTTLPVPERTQAEVVPGVRLITVKERRPRSDKGLPKGPRAPQRRSKIRGLVRKSDRRAAREPFVPVPRLTAEEKVEASKQRHPAARFAAARPETADLSSVETMIERLVQQRCGDLAARLEAAEARAVIAEQKLASLRGLLS
jgi:hypothetical protein